MPTDTIRAKWTMDGAATLSEAARMLRDFADHLEELEREGWQLIEPVSDDYGDIEKRPKRERSKVDQDRAQ
jgi:hypothetical protein